MLTASYVNMHMRCLVGLGGGGGGGGREGGGGGRRAYIKPFLDMVTFALKTWKNKVKMYEVIGIQCPTPAS